VGFGNNIGWPILERMRVVHQASILLLPSDTVKNRAFQDPSQEVQPQKIVVSNSFVDMEGNVIAVGKGLGEELHMGHCCRVVDNKT
jgi:hypothetical protein